MIQEKICSKCKGDPKPVSEFNERSNVIDGLSSWCSHCCNTLIKNYRHSEKGLLKYIYYSQVRSSKQRNHKPPTYSINELIEFGLSHPDFTQLYWAWVKSGYKTKLKPSFDRKYNDEGYSFDNFRGWVTWAINKQRGHEDSKNGKLITGNPYKPVKGINIKTGEVLKFCSMREASRKTGINQSRISGCCNNKYGHKTAGRYKWLYIK